MIITLSNDGSNEMLPPLAPRLNDDGTAGSKTNSTAWNRKVEGGDIQASRN